jgi:hypothetical protein
VRPKSVWKAAFFGGCFSAFRPGDGQRKAAAGRPCQPRVGNGPLTRKSGSDLSSFFILTSAY